MFSYETIVLRPLQESDLEQVRTLRNSPSTWMYLTSVGMISQQEQQAWFDKITSDSSVKYLAIVKREKDDFYPIEWEGDFLGIIRLDQWDKCNRSIRIGLDIVPGERSKGWGTIAFKATLEFVFNHLNTHLAWLMVLEDNDVAKKLYFKAGLVETGYLPDAVFRNGQYKTYVIMAIIEDEYRKFKQ